MVETLGALVAELLGHPANGLGGVFVYSAFIVEGIGNRRRRKASYTANLSNSNVAHGTLRLDSPPKVKTEHYPKCNRSV